ncbi:helicase-related protein [Fibrobacter sp. UWB13]|uniref:helicase-related protein n=1 Tax=Fibrobacter sp. UWB13 TaxID=1896204 RepID=UPI000A0AD25A|nr:helicase-related protein [Fibrobacter sp. UWB13]SMG12389.1 Superfamily II DNA or RNA helicase, SNF2 family [Fibrobacter sp. UWB13]
MTVIDNINQKLRDDLALEIKQGSKVSIAASCFSIYAYQELKKQLENIEELRFIFTSPTFISESFPKEKKEFFIPRLNRERSLYGSDFEVRLRNELSQKAIARECAEWIREKARFKSNFTSEHMLGFANVDSTSYSPLRGFTTVDLGCERGDNIYNFVTKLEAPHSSQFLQLFDSLWNDSGKMQDVTETVIENISAAYNENSPAFIYFVTLYHIFSEFLQDISEDTLPNEKSGFKQSKIWNMLYNFQKDAALGVINKLEKYNGCILADSVGLGKTFTALAVIKYYENRNKSVLVLCPKKLANNWNTYRGFYEDNPVYEDRLGYTVLFHTDLNRESGDSNGTDLSRIKWSAFDLVVIDESHNFRNGSKYKTSKGKMVDDDFELDEIDKMNRYATLLNNVIKQGVKTKVLMLSATPVNNRFNDLKNQLALAYEGKEENINDKLSTDKGIGEVFRNAQKAYNTWSKFEAKDRMTENLLKLLDSDFFRVLDAVTIARSRKHIQRYYDTADIGKFPERLKPISKSPKLTDVSGVCDYNKVYELLCKLDLSVYTPTSFILPSCREKYELADDEYRSLSQAGREQGIRRLMSINLLKRMESSVYSFNITVKKIKKLIDSKIQEIDEFIKQKTSHQKIELAEFATGNFVDDFDADDQNDDVLYGVKKHLRIDLADMDYVSWRASLATDSALLDSLLSMTSVVTPEHDGKLQELLSLIKNKVESPINDGNKKVIVFTAFADTADYLYTHVSAFVKAKFGLETAMISGTEEGRTTAKLKKRDMNTVLTCFSPISKNKAAMKSKETAVIDILIATDCISEGQNLQDSDYLVNYDIHWNPVRIIQRFGRIDRIGSKNDKIQLVNFWPDVTLDEYIQLKARVEARMKIVDMTSTGDDNIIDENEKADLEYRKSQLQKLREEVVDLEEMNGGISITDLGLNEFHLDLLDYVKKHPDIENAPLGLHSVVQATKENPPGVIYVLKNRVKDVNIDKRNPIHPFYMVYITDDGNIVCNHLNPKKLLDEMRLLCRNQAEPIAGLYRLFNKETRDGRDMKKYSKLLGEAIVSLVAKKEESQMDCFLNGDFVDFKSEVVKGLDDFELICFLVVR